MDDVLLQTIVSDTGTNICLKCLLAKSQLDAFQMRRFIQSLVVVCSNFVPVVKWITFEFPALIALELEPGPPLR